MKLVTFKLLGWVTISKNKNLHCAAPDILCSMGSEEARLRWNGWLAARGGKEATHLCHALYYQLGIDINRY